MNVVWAVVEFILIGFKQELCCGGEIPSMAS